MKSKVRFLAFVLATLMLLAACASTNTTSTLRTPAQDSEPIYRGRIIGDTYTNDSIQISFTLPSGWVFADDTFLATLMRIDVETLVGKSASLGSFFDEGGRTIVDMFMWDGKDTKDTFVMVTISDIGRAEIPMYELLEAFKSGTATLDSVEVTLRDTSEITIGENTYYVMAMYFEVPDLVPRFGKQHHLIRRQGSYFININIQNFSGEKTFDEIITYFN